MPALGWSSWVALGPGSQHPVLDFCDEASVMASIDAFHDVGLFDAGYRHFNLVCSLPHFLTVSSPLASRDPANSRDAATRPFAQPWAAG